MGMLIGLALGLAAAAAEPPPTAGFDCARAASASEKAICADTGLAAQDRRLSRLYAELQRDEQGREARRDAQRAWLRQRDDDCGANTGCLHGSYAVRLRDLLAEAPALRPHASPSAEDIAAALRLFDLLEPDELELIAVHPNDEYLSELSCRYFERDPRRAERLFAPTGSLRDGWLPLCRSLDAAKRLPALQPLVEELWTAFGSTGDRFCEGTIAGSYRWRQQVARILALVDLKPDIATYEAERAQRVADLGYSPDLAHWAQQGLWEKRQAERIERHLPAARTALRDYYQHDHALDRAAAERLAAYHVQRLVDAYTGRTGHTSTLAYASACYGREDLDRYLKSGELPTLRCPYAEFLDTSPAGLRGYLLNLALVDDYPIAVVQRLVDEGARVDAKPGTDVETPLMRAAARADAITTLLRAGADPQRRNSFGKTALMHAVAEKNRAGVEALLAAQADAKAATYLDPHKSCTALKAGSRSVLIYAAWQSTPEIAAALLGAGADPAARDSNGESALDYLPRNTALDDKQRAAMTRLLTPTP